MIVDVLILYEHVAREYEAALLLKRCLEKRGLSVQIKKINWDDGLSHLLITPKVIITPWCYDDSDYHMLTTLWRGAYKGNKVKIVNLHCEQIANSDAQEFLIPKGNAKKVYHLAWGDFFKQILIVNGIRDDLIWVTGSPRLDFFRTEYRKACYSKDELGLQFGIDKSKRWVLLIGNFSGKNQTPKERERIKEKGYSKIDDWANMTRKNYDELINWYQYACEKTSECVYIYRPHPNETITDEILSLQEKFDNFFVIKEYSIKDWIVNSDIAFAWCSTSAVEVASANIPIINLRPFDIPNELRFPLIEDIYQVESKEKFVEIINMSNFNQLLAYNTKFRDDISYFYNLKGKSATERTVESIVDIMHTEDNLIQTHYDYIGAFFKTFRFAVKILLLKLGIKIKSVTEININDVLTREMSQEYDEKVGRIDV